MAVETFETFLNLMEKNWPEAHQNLSPVLPLIDKIQSITEVQRSQMMAEYGLQSSDFGILTALRRSPEPYLLTPTQLMDHMLISSGGLTKALYRLENKGMLCRKSSQNDGRVKLVQLTEKGRLTTEEIGIKAQKNHHVLKANLSEQEAEQLDKLLRKLLYAIEEN